MFKRLTVFSKKLHVHALLPALSLLLQTNTFEI